jgi:hypothetical protein
MSSASSVAARGRGKRQRGIAMILAIFSMMLLSAIAIGMLLMTDSESTVNANYRDAQRAYFEARAGIEEARARLEANDPLVIPGGGSSALAASTMPNSAGGIVYILNPHTGETVAPWNTANSFYDTEFCHENAGVTGQSNPGTALVPCSPANTSSIPSADYVSQTSVGPNFGTTGSLDYRWVRVTLKQNGNTSPSGSTTYYVNPSVAATGPVCWDGSAEHAYAAGTICSNVSMAPVYMLTALSIGPMGSRRMVQYEWAPPVTGTSPSMKLSVGMGATGTGCGAITMSGGTTADWFDSGGNNGSGGPVSSYNNSKSTSSTQTVMGLSDPNANINLSGGPSIGGGIAANHTPWSTPAANLYNSNQGTNCNANGITSTGGGSCACQNGFANCLPRRSLGPMYRKWQSGHPCLRVGSGHSNTDFGSQRELSAELECPNRESFSGQRFRARRLGKCPQYNRGRQRGHSYGRKL